MGIFIFLNSMIHGSKAVHYLCLKIKWMKYRLLVKNSRENWHNADRTWLPRVISRSYACFVCHDGKKRCIHMYQRVVWHPPSSMGRTIPFKGHIFCSDCGCPQCSRSMQRSNVSDLSIDYWHLGWHYYIRLWVSDSVASYGVKMFGQHKQFHRSKGLS